MILELAIISGKGGTGKTTITAAFASIAQNIVLADCDVDAPDLHILLQPDIKSSSDYIGTKVAIIDELLCTECGLCQQHCRYDAAFPPLIDSIACEGCGVCEFVCPEQAIRLEDKVSGFVYESETRFGPMAHARLHAGEGNSGKVVTEVRKRALDLAKRYAISTILVDGSPGIGCPVIATVTGLRLGVIVTEPTMSGIHDMERVLTLMRQLKVRSAVIINKYDLNPDMANQIEIYCREHDVELLGRIPFDSIMTQSMVATKTLPEFASDHPITKKLVQMWSRILELLEE